jgi:hypothetical protein
VKASLLIPTEQAHQHAGHVGTTTGDAEALFKEAKRRRRRRWIVGCSILLIGVVVAGGLLAITTTGRRGSSHQTSRPLQARKAVAQTGQRPGNLDILTGGLQVSAHLANGGHRGSAKLAGPGVRAPIAFSRQGYVMAVGVGGYESVSYDLQTIFFTWSGSQGSNPVPASNRADVWLSDPVGHSGQAQEFDEYGRTVGSPVGIPADSVVLGQTDSNLVLVVQGTSFGQPLVLWNPIEQRIVATLGQFQQQVSTPTFVAWTEGNALYVDSPEGSRLSSASGPTDDWATALASDPNSTKLAVVWAPRPGSPRATSRNVIDRDSRLGLMNIAAGTSRLVDGSEGVIGPLAWAPDGSGLYFGQVARHSQAVKIATYVLASGEVTSLELPKLNLPSFFNQSTGALISWARS